MRTVLPEFVFLSLLWFAFVSFQKRNSPENFRGFILRPIFYALILSNLSGGLLYLMDNSFLLIWFNLIIIGLVSAVLFHLFHGKVKWSKTVRYLIPVLYLAVMLLINRCYLAGSSDDFFNLFISGVKYLLEGSMIVFIWYKGIR